TLTSGQLVADGGSSVTIAGLTSIDGSSFLATGGGHLTVPAASYSFADTQNSPSRVFRAEGIGSLLELKNLTPITNGNSYNSQTRIEAVGGATVDLRAVTQLADVSSGDTRFRSIDVLVDGFGSTLRLDALASFTDASGTSAGFTDGRWSTL